MATEVESEHRHPSPAMSSPEANSFGDDIGSTARSNLTADRPVRLLLIVVATAFCVLWTWVSYLRWANFGYRTFDLAYYVQAVWQLIHGRFALTVENVPLLGNHVEPIVFLFAPIFAVVRHPMLFVFVQNAALASMAPLGYVLARRLFDRGTSLLLSLGLLLAPATSFVALHEFHPEALSAPLLLLLIYTRTTGRLWLYWVSFLAVLACKENMALLLAAYCLVFLVLDRRRGFASLIRWYALPLLGAVIWFFVCTKVITPAFNSGNIDYLSLYNRLGKNAGEIIWNAITRPQLIGQALVQSLTHGNLVWGLLLPFAFLPLLRPRWLLISAPIFLQHLLSWRSSEWSIYFHYAAPLLPLLWFGSVEGLAMLRNRWPAVTRSQLVAAVGAVLVLACVATQLAIGPAPVVWPELRSYSKNSAERIRKEKFIAQIPATASVVAPLPYLSHLAMREKLYSLHYILKGLKTLSRERYQPPSPADFVLIDYGDAATFDASAGYYHPEMRTADGALIPSSDQLLHQFFGQLVWETTCENELTLSRTEHRVVVTGPGIIDPNPSGTELNGSLLVRDQTSIAQSEIPGRSLQINFEWRLQEDRTVFPWMVLQVHGPGDKPVASVTKGLCGIEKTNGFAAEQWRVLLPSDLPAGTYTAEAVFFDNSKRAWRQTHGQQDMASELLMPPFPLGKITVSAPAP